MKKSIAIFFLVFVSIGVSYSQQAPTIVSFNPTGNALNVQRNTNITVTFNKDVDQTTLTNSTIRVHGAQSGLHSSSNIKYDSTHKTVTFDPKDDFKIGELVTVTVTRGIKSMSGDSLANSLVSSYTIVSNPSSATFIRKTYASDDAHAAVVGDIGGNGTSDVVLGATSGISVFMGNNGDYTSGGHYPLSNCFSLVLGDWNNDGKMDLASGGGDSVYIRVDDGTGNLTAYQTINTSSTMLVSGDIDGDGYLDIVRSSYFAQNVTILKNNGFGTFIISSTINVAGAYGICMSDFDNDGALDIAVVSYDASYTLSILRNDGAGKFQLAHTYNLGNYIQRVEAGDVNNDGYNDLVVSVNGNGSGTTLAVLKNDGNGAFTRGADINIGYPTTFLKLADLDGDGDLDVVVSETSSQLVIALNDGQGAFSKSVGYPISQYYDLSIADLNGDGKLDVLTGDIGSTFSIWKNQDLIAYYPFNGNAKDSSANGNDGTVDGAALTSDRFGNTGTAYSFDGVGNYIEIADSASLHVNGDITTSIWVKGTLPGVPIAKYDAANDAGWSIQLRPGGGADFGVRDHSGSYKSSGVTPIFDGTWHMLVGQRKGTALKIFLDGVLSRQDTVGSSGSIVNSLSMTIGTQNDSHTNNFWTGSIDDIRIYNRALSDSEVNLLYRERGWPTGVDVHGSTLPAKYLLSQNYPNPFNPSTTIEYQLSEQSFVTLRIYDVLGREVEMLVNERRNAGVYSVQLDASALPTGVYFYRLQAGDFTQTRKLLLLK